MNKMEAVKATKNGVIAACISAAMTLIFMVIAISSDLDGKYALWNDPWTIVDVFLILACAYGIYKKSRFASVLLFVYFLLAKILIAIDTQSINGVILGLVFLYFYGKAVQGSYTYHKFEKEENPDYKQPSKWLYIVGAPSFLFILVIMGFGLMSTTGVLPSTVVQSGSEVFDKDRKILIDNGILSNNDEIIYFYAHGATSILESGNVLTRDRVILYLTDENNEIQIYGSPLNEVTNINLEKQGDYINLSEYIVSTDRPDRWITLYLSIERKGDEKFVQAIRNQLIR